MANNGALNYTPTTSQQSIPAGYTSGGTISAVTSAIDSNITQANIRSGVTILGIQGNLEPDKPDQTKTATPTTTQQLIEPDTGYELASVTVEAVDNTIDANIVAENIKKDITILGVTGTLSEDYSGTITPEEYDTALETTSDILGTNTPNYIDLLDDLTLSNVSTVVYQTNRTDDYDLSSISNFKNSINIIDESEMYSAEVLQSFKDNLESVIISKSTTNDNKIALVMFMIFNSDFSYYNDFGECDVNVHSTGDKIMTMTLANQSQIIDGHRIYYHYNVSYTPETLNTAYTNATTTISNGGELDFAFTGDM